MLGDWLGLLHAGFKHTPQRTSLSVTLRVDYLVRRNLKLLLDLVARRALIHSTGRVQLPDAQRFLRGKSAAQGQTCC